MSHTERDENICVMYREGATQATLAVRFALTEARVGQILAQAGLTKMSRISLRTGRTRFTALHLSEGAKEALRKEAKRDGVSMSAWIARLVAKELRDRGIDYEIAQFLKEEDVRLPLES